MHFGERIKELRESQGLLQRQLAANLEIDTPMFSKIERGERNAKREQVIALAKFLNVSEDELLTIWLSDKIIDNVRDETAALAALKHAEQELKKKSK
ncbi:helix-turn-helix domain-containing protein [Anditalea andensis]|uniref:XRE family transcriptional regulator n=1 Tax=Anditalea andensis TaxID=1048983 RepID=A0A074KVJ0_9BACT|nr:helix-turn-helix transcriptional regulator [Anditalea andensis]KEO72260.1 XRE family transcriptional regulator [Anditalea andensis]